MRTRLVYVLNFRLSITKTDPLQKVHTYYNNDTAIHHYCSTYKGIIMCSTRTLFLRLIQQSCLRCILLHYCVTPKFERNCMSDEAFLPGIEPVCDLLYFLLAFNF